MTDDCKRLVVGVDKILTDIVNAIPIPPDSKLATKKDIAKLIKLLIEQAEANPNLSQDFNTYYQLIEEEINELSNDK